MARRPILDKKVNRMRRALRKGRLPTYIDLIQWLKDRDYAQTTGEAKRIILAGRVKADSHTLGIQEFDYIDKSGKKRTYRGVVNAPSALRDRIIVESA